MEEPLSLAKYLYVQGNPVNAIDPSGMFLEDSSVSSIGFSILNVLRPALPIFKYLGGISKEVTTVLLAVYIAQQVKNQLAVSIARACTLSGDQKCDTSIPTVFYGDSYNGKPLVETTNHIKDAIIGSKPPLLSRWDIKPEGHGSDGWYKSKPECSGPARYAYKAQYFQKTGINLVNKQINCDEYPFNQSEQGGLKNYNAGGVSLRNVHIDENIQGTLMDDFKLQQAGVIKGNVLYKWYAVVSIPGLPVAFWKDRDGNIVS